MNTSKRIIGKNINPYNKKLLLPITKIAINLSEPVWYNDLAIITS
jgi:hypothetical protein